MARQTRPRLALTSHGSAWANPQGSGWLVLVLVLLVLPELALVAADHGLWGSAAWRRVAYQNGAFWAGLLRDWRPNYALQPALMFVTYAFLHAGPGHLLGNLLALMPLGQATLRWLGPSRTLGVAAAAALGGGLAFGLLSRDPSPMVGASGVVFGLAGALALREGLGRDGASPWRALALVGALALVNLATWVLVERVAWETHAGGALAGAGAAWMLRPRGGTGPTPADLQAAGLGVTSAPADRPPARSNTLS